MNSQGCDESQRYSSEFGGCDEYGSCGECIEAHESPDSGLTPELSRTAARNGGVVHVTMQPSREAVSA